MRAKIAFAAFLLTFAISCAQKSITSASGGGAALESPDKKIQIHFAAGKNLSYRVSFTGKNISGDSRLGLEFQGWSPGIWEILKINHAEIEVSYALVTGKAHEVREQHEVYTIQLRESGGGRLLNIKFQISNDGFGFRYEIPEQSTFSAFALTGESTTFSFTGDPMLYALELPVPSSFEGYYRNAPLSEFKTGSTMNLPVMLRSEAVWIAVTEAALSDFAGLNLARDKSGVLSSILTPSRTNSNIRVEGRTPFVSPWRVMLISTRPGTLLESNLITSLNEPSVIADTSWIRPGKIIFPWWSGYNLKVEEKVPAHQPGLNTWSLKRYADFAAANGIEFFSLDGYDQAWYGGGIDKPAAGIDLTKAIPQIDLPEVLRYAKAKKVRLRIWMHIDPLLRAGNLDALFATYEKWGVEGIMADFINNDDQATVRAHTEILKAAARHHLTVNFHGIWKPTGLHRTYPNLLSHEAVLSSEYNRFTSEQIHGSPPEHETNYSWVRAIAGAADIHPGSFNPVTPEKFHPPGDALRAMGTLARQLALYVVIESGLPMVSDAPSEYLKRPRAFEFVKKVPAAWDQTHVVGGTPGESIAIARQKGKTWYLGAITDRSARTLNISLGFLGKGRFRARIWSDDAADNGKTNYAEKFVTASDFLPIKIEKSGGQAIIFSR